MSKTFGKSPWHFYFFNQRSINCFIYECITDSIMYARAYLIRYNGYIVICQGYIRILT